MAIFDCITVVSNEPVLLVVNACTCEVSSLYMYFTVQY